MYYEFAKDINNHSVNFMISTTYIGLGFSIAFGDFSIFAQIHLGIFTLTVIWDKGGRISYEEESD